MHAMAEGDFNRDGIKDLAIGSENTKLHILLGVGDGTFLRQPEMTLIPGGDLFSASNDVDVADFNRDTIQDLVVPLGNGNGNVVLLGNGDGTFRPSFRITENAVSSPLNLAVADFNLDGLQDIARAMGDGTSGLAMGRFKRRYVISCRLISRASAASSLQRAISTAMANRTLLC
jgi:hypothetical protein